MKTSLYLKLFELSIEQGGQMMHRFKKAIGSLFFIEVSSNSRYKINAKKYLELALN